MGVQGLPATFEMQVRCVDRNGDLVATFGREGEGPGEFQLPPRLLRGPNGTVGAISFDRLTIFTHGGDLVDQTITGMSRSGRESLWKDG